MAEAQPLQLSERRTFTYRVCAGLVSGLRTAGWHTVATAHEFTAPAPFLRPHTLRFYRSIDAVVVHTERLLVHVWGHRGSGDRQLLKQLVHRLRHKIGDDPEQPRWLSTIPSVGYMLRVAPPRSGPDETLAK